MRTRIEEAAIEYGNKAIGNMSPRNDDYGISHYNLIKGFIAGAEFMQSEADKKLAEEMGLSDRYLTKCQKLEAQNEVMRKALKEAYSYLENSEHCKHADKAYYIIDNAIEVLKKVGEV